MPAERRDRCRSCRSTALRAFLDLGELPLPDALVTDEELAQPEPRYPLQVGLCADCALVQLLHDVSPTRLFVDNYLYFSSYSEDLLAHARRHADWLVEDRGLGPSNLVVEIASNDGYLLGRVAGRGVQVLGVDPAPAQAAAAERAGVPTLQAFFSADLGGRLRAERGPADVIVANNVMAHVPDPDDFVAGLAALLAEDGLVTIENPNVKDLVERGAFDTIYHEHFSYFSCVAVERLLRRHGLHLNDVEYFADLHAGTMRWHAGKSPRRSARVDGWLAVEVAAGVADIAHYEGFADRVRTTVSELRSLLTELRRDGARIAAYGAAAKGAVLCNVAGLGPDVLDYVIDRNPHKQGRYLPGVRLRVHDPAVLDVDRPDYLLLLAWNFADEIMRQQRAYADAGGRFILPMPHPRVL